jgi:AcrR family transcriptional regulator
VRRRAYRLGQRQTSVDLTTNSILAAARELVAQGPASQASVGAVARRAGVSRITVYNRFGSRAGLLEALAPPRERRELEETDPREALRRHIQSACATWASNPALYRHLPDAQIDDPEANRALAEALATGDDLRPGCSIKEAEDVVGALTSFAVFDRLHKDGRRPAAAVGEILTRLASAILA